MLVSKKVIVKWNSKTKKHYESLGYQYTKMGDSFEILIGELKASSNEKILIKCDYCGNTYFKKFSDRSKNIENSIIKKDACTKCKHIKAKEGIENLYGVSNIMDIPGAKEKRDETIFSIYGVDNVFRLEETKKKIRKTTLEKYGKESFTQTALYEEKRIKTSLERYGEESHMKTEKYREMFSGKNSPRWKGGKNDPRWDRLKPKYKKWRTDVFSKDKYICQKCKKKKKNLEAHHIYNWKDNPEKRYDPNNGVTLCVSCHVEFHRQFGKKNNNPKELEIFLEQT